MYTLNITADFRRLETNTTGTEFIERVEFETLHELTEYINKLYGNFTGHHEITRLECDEGYQAEPSKAHFEVTYKFDAKQLIPFNVIL